MAGGGRNNQSLVDALHAMAQTMAQENEALQGAQQHSHGGVDELWPDRFMRNILSSSL